MREPTDHDDRGQRGRKTTTIGKSGTSSKAGELRDVRGCRHVRAAAVEQLRSAAAVGAVLQARHGATLSAVVY